MSVGGIEIDEHIFFHFQSRENYRNLKRVFKSPCKTCMNYLRNNFEQP